MKLLTKLDSVAAYGTNTSTESLSESRVLSVDVTSDIRNIHSFQLRGDTLVNWNRKGPDKRPVTEQLPVSSHVKVVGFW